MLQDEEIISDQQLTDFAHYLSFKPYYISPRKDNPITSPLQHLQLDSLFYYTLFS